MVSFRYVRLTPGGVCADGPAGIFLNHGQACCAGSRVFVHEKIYDQFKEQFLAHVKKLKVGNPFEADTFQGPQISQIQYDVSPRHPSAVRR